MMDWNRHDLCPYMALYWPVIVRAGPIFGLIYGSTCWAYNGESHGANSVMQWDIYAIRLQLVELAMMVAHATLNTWVILICGLLPSLAMWNSDTSWKDRCGFDTNFYLIKRLRVYSISGVTDNAQLNSWKYQCHFSSKRLFNTGSAVHNTLATDTMLQASFRKTNSMRERDIARGKNNRA